MPLRTALVAVIAATTLFVSAPASATTIGNADDVLTRTLVYRLGDGASFAEGCIGGDPPCLCPIQLGQNLRGTMLLRPTPSGVDTLQRFRVEQVNWLGSLNGERRIVGDGTLEIDTSTDGPSPAFTRLQLRLRIGEGDFVDYDSGWVELYDFNSVDISIAPVGNPCFGAVFTVSALPVPATEMIGYALGDTSLFFEGCYEPCLCPISFAQVAGGFALVPLPNAPAIHDEWALVRINWRSFDDTPGAPSFITARGAGIYQINTAALTPVPPHRLVLDLDVNRLTPEQQPVNYDSGWVFKTEDIGASPPRIKVEAAENAFFCFDRVFSIDAAPTDSTSPLLGLTSAAPSTLRVEPDLPDGWELIENPAIPMGGHRVDLVVQDMGDHQRHVAFNTTATPMTLDTVLGVKAGMGVCDAQVDGISVPFTRVYDGATLVGVRIVVELGLDPDTPTVIDLLTRKSADFNTDAFLNDQDFFDFVNAFFGPAGADFNEDGAANDQDFFDFVNSFFGGCA